MRTPMPRVRRTNMGFVLSCITIPVAKLFRDPIRSIKQLSFWSIIITTFRSIHAYDFTEVLTFATVSIKDNTTQQQFNFTD